MWWLTDQSPKGGGTLYQRGGEFCQEGAANLCAGKGGDSVIDRGTTSTFSSPWWEEGEGAPTFLRKNSLRGGIVHDR